MGQEDAEAEAEIELADWGEVEHVNKQSGAKFFRKDKEEMLDSKRVGSRVRTRINSPNQLLQDFVWKPNVA